jgi:hypothetical protein
VSRSGLRQTSPTCDQFRIWRDHRAGLEARASGEAALGPDRLAHETGGQLGTLALVDLPANDLAAEDVEDQVMVEEPQGPGGGGRSRRPLRPPAGETEMTRAVLLETHHAHFPSR